MVSDVFCMRHFNLISWYLFLFIFDDIILLKLEPLFESYVKNDIVLEVKRADVKCSICLIHNSVINFELGQKTSITSIVIEFNCLHEIGCVIGVVFIGFDHRHVSLLSLNNVQRQISQIIFIVFRVQETLDFDDALVIAIRIFSFVIASRQLKVGSTWIFDHLSFIFDVTL